MGENDHLGKQSSLKPVLVTIAWLLAIIAGCMCLIGYQVCTDIVQKKKAEAANVYTPSLAEREIELAKNTLYENGLVSELIANVSKENSPKWTFFISNTGKYVVQVEGFVDDVTRFNSAITSNRASLKYTPIYDYKDGGFQSVIYRVQFVKQLGVENKTKYNTYFLSYSEYSLNYNDHGTLRTETVNGYSENILDHFEAYLQDSSL